jgi:hypothetical protein
MTTMTTLLADIGKFKKLEREVIVVTSQQMS